MEAVVFDDVPSPQGLTVSQLVSLVSDGHAQSIAAEGRLKKAKKKHKRVSEEPPNGVADQAAGSEERTGPALKHIPPEELALQRAKKKSSGIRRASDFEITLNPRGHSEMYAKKAGTETSSTSAPSSPRAVPKSRNSFQTQEKPAWDDKKKKSTRKVSKLDAEAGKASSSGSPLKMRVSDQPRTSKKSTQLDVAVSTASAKPGLSAQTDLGAAGVEIKSKVRKASVAVCDEPFGSLSGGGGRLDSLQRAVQKKDAAEMRRLEDMLSKVREAVDTERQSMAAERAQSEASCAFVLERASHSWLRIWQVQRAYAGTKEAALLALPWRGHLSFPFLHWKRTAQEKGARRRQRRHADLEYKRSVFRRWQQAGHLSAGLSVSLAAFERRRCRAQQRCAFLAWKGMLDDRKTALFRLRQCVQTWQANRLRQAWDRWRAGVEMQQSKAARLARACRHLQSIRLRWVFREWRVLVSLSARARAVIRHSEVRLQQRALLRAFLGWREAVAELQRQRAIMHRAAAHIMHSALAQAFSTWVANAGLQASVRRFAVVLRNRALLAAFNQWRSAVVESRQMEHDLRQVFAHRHEEFAGEMLSRWRAWRGGGPTDESGAAAALRRGFRKWRALLQEKRQLRAHARRMVRQRAFRQWRSHTRWCKTLQATTMQRRALERWRDWIGARLRGKSLAGLEAALASSGERERDLRAQLQQVQDERDAAKQRAADLVAAVRSLDWKLQSAAAGGGASPPRSPRVHSMIQMGQTKRGLRGKGIGSRPHEHLLDI